MANTTGTRLYDHIAHMLQMLQMWQITWQLGRCVKQSDGCGSSCSEDVSV